MKIVHLAVLRQLTPGITKQLRFEHDAARKLEDVQWTTIVYHDSPAIESYMRQTPILFRALFMRNLWGWLIALRLSIKYDIVMMRHMPFDPFAFIFAPLIKNRVSVHHSKEIEELLLVRRGWRGKAASQLERVSGSFTVKRARIILGVTQEIAEYEREKAGLSKQVIGVYSNGIDLQKIFILSDKRVSNEVHAAFICSEFSGWHGLDKLINSTNNYMDKNIKYSLIIHLIGILTDAQKNEIELIKMQCITFRIYGLRPEAEYRLILEQCDIGIASLAMERKELSEGSTLKVREMLAMGLPVYSGHKDIALPESESFVKVSQHPSLQEILEFGITTKKIDRKFVRDKSLKRIDKESSMKSVVKIFKNFQTNRWRSRQVPPAKPVA